MPLLASMLLLSAPGAALGSDAIQPPPGFVLVQGGRTKIGSSQKDIERLIQQNPTLESTFGPLVGETPQNTVDVGDFYLMVTEVTNEQYERYVKATGARPPFHWGSEAIEVARAAFVKAEVDRREAAKAAGQPPPERQAFEPQAWWAQNWPGKAYKVPDGQACKPVVYVDYQDAVGYARWAGLRLMTEEEYQRAVRGDTDRPYPWGDAWERGKYAATNEIQGISDTFEVGHFAEGATESGIFDLAGNVWEWTASKFVPYQGYKAFKLDVGKGDKRKTLDNLPDFNPDRRVVVGGSFQTPRQAARATIRRGSDRSQQVNAMGFRCAASPEPGRDVSDTLARDIPPELRPTNVGGPLQYDAKLALALDRWSTAAPSCKVAGYSVIEAYDYILFTPVEEVYQVTLKDLRDYSLAEQVVPLGFLATNQTLIDPALEPGTYLVSLRGAGETIQPKPTAPETPEKAGKPAGQGVHAQEQGQGEEGAPPAASQEPAVVPLEQQLPFDVTLDHYIFFDLAGKPVAAIPAPGIDLGRPVEGSIRFVDRTVQVAAPALEGEKPKMIDEVQKWLELGLAVPARARKVFQGKLALRFADGVAEREWRQ